MSVSRPVLRYLGGKFRMAPWIIGQLPAHKVYIEPFGGAANVLLRKPRSLVEIYNDLDDDVVNLFRVLRNEEQAERLIGLLELTPFARTEFVAAYGVTTDPVERARRMIVRAFMGHGSCAARIDRTTGFRGINLAAGNPSPPRTWVGYPAALREVVDRLKGVAIEQRSAFDLIQDEDRPEALFYVDPPYVQSTRSRKQTRGAPSNGYAHELSDAQHEALLDLLLSLKGMVALSGYACPLYDTALQGWSRRERDVLADGGRPRREVLWLNPAACARDLFGVAA